MNFKSEYSFRVYELLKQYETVGSRVLLIEELKEFLDTDQKSYEKYNRFKEKVLLKALQEINKHSDITVKMQEIKKGRKVEAVEFEILKNNNYITPLDNWEDYQRMSNKTRIELADILQSLIQNKYKVNFTSAHTDIICKEAIISLIQQIKEKEFESVAISSPILYFQQVLLNIHNKHTGEELTKADLRRAEIERMMLK